MFCTYLIPRIIWVIRQMMVRWTECVLSVREKKNGYRDMLDKPEGKIS
jgi:hypothetical protein